MYAKPDWLKFFNRATVGQCITTNTFNLQIKIDYGIIASAAKSPTQCEKFSFSNHVIASGDCDTS